MNDEDPPLPFFTVLQKTASTQTPVNYYSDVESLNSPYDFDLPPDFNGTGPTLLHQYYANTKYYLDHFDPSLLSPYKQEIFTKVKQQSIFRSKIFNSANLPDGTIPPNTFENLTVSLYLIIFSDHFTFSTAIPGVEINGDLNDDASRVLSYVSQGLLPPRFVDSVKDLNLTWYDGGLICEISDQRKAYSHPLRVLMRINPIDITNCGFEIEQAFLLNRFPLLCLDPDIQVSKLSREIASDSQRWQPSQISAQTPAEFLQSEYPSIFIEPIEPKKPRVRIESKHSEEELKKMLMIKLGIIKDDQVQSKETEQVQPKQEQSQTNEAEHPIHAPNTLHDSHENLTNSIANPDSEKQNAASLPLAGNSQAAAIPNVAQSPLANLSYNSKTAISQQIVKLMQQKISDSNFNRALKLFSESSSNPDLKNSNLQDQNNNNNNSNE